MIENNLKILKISPNITILDDSPIGTRILMGFVVYFCSILKPKQMNKVSMTFCSSIVIIVIFLVAAGYIMLNVGKNDAANYKSVALPLSSLVSGVFVLASSFLHNAFLGDLAMEIILLSFLMREVFPCPDSLFSKSIAILYVIVCSTVFFRPLHMALFFSTELAAIVMGGLMLYWRISRPSLLVAHVSTPAIVHDSIVSAGWMLAIFFPSLSIVSRIIHVPVAVIVVLSCCLLLPVVLVLCLAPVVPKLVRWIRSYSIGRHYSPADSRQMRDGRMEARAVLFKAIEQWIVDDKAYLDPGMCVDEVTEHFYTNRNYVTEAFGEFAHMSFSEYMNRVRVNHARKLAESNPWITVSELAFQSGYTVPTTFSMAFIKIYGISPREWLSDLRAQRKK